MREFIMRYWLEVLFSLVIAYLGLARKKILKRCKTRKAMELGILSLLRAQIIEYHHHYVEKCHCPIYAKENLEDMFSAYTDLGGNGTVPDLVKTIRSLPTDPPKRTRREVNPNG